MFDASGSLRFRPAVVEIYPEQYEGQESDPLIFCTGPVPAQQADPFIGWLMRETGAKSFYLPSADYVWPRIMNAGTPFFELLHDAGFAKRGGHLVCTHFDENFLNMVPAAHVEGLIRRSASSRRRHSPAERARLHATTIPHDRTAGEGREQCCS